MFEIKEDFYWNGKPIKIISGSIHYFRVVPEYWEDRLQKLKAMGCNTVETYVPWNFHEPKEGEYHFDGQHDIKRFIEIANALDLFVIVRPSPYICAEWEFGGLPSWLLKDRNMKLRTAYPPFMEKVERYFERLFKELVPLQFTKGGPIIMMQVENEYGSYGADKEYMNQVMDLMLENGVDVPLVTSDGSWSDMLVNGTVVDRALPTVNFGSKPKEHFGILKNFVDRPIPLMVMEYWIGWFSAWGNDEYKQTDSASQAEDLRDILTMGHVNFYMFHGGTHFGFNNGSNYYDAFSPDITSYDYDAPLSEWGDVTEKYRVFRDVISDFVEGPLPELPEPVKKANYGTVTVKNRTSLFDNLTQLARPVTTPYPLTMEDLDQDTGYILYQHDLGGKRDVTMELINGNDRTKGYINREPVFTQYDKEVGSPIETQLKDESNELMLLVENMGRINYGPRIPNQRKGIENLHVNSGFRSQWTHYPLPLDNIEQVDFSREYRENEPSFSQFELNVGEANDTFIDMTGWGKGAVFINGFNLGRYWEVGPQYKLYIPAPLLKKGVNDIVIFETEGKVKEEITFTDEPPYVR